MFVIITLYVQYLGCCLDHKICTLLKMQYLLFGIIPGCLYIFLPPCQHCHPFLLVPDPHPWPGNLPCHSRFVFFHPGSSRLTVLPAGKFLHILFTSNLPRTLGTSISSHPHHVLASFTLANPLNRHPTLIICFTPIMSPRLGLSGRVYLVYIVT